MLLLTSGQEREVFYPQAKWKRSYLVTDKYPPRSGKAEFLIFLQDRDGDSCQAIVDQSLYGNFEVADVLRFGRGNPRKPDAKGWLVIQGKYKVLRAVPSLDYLSIQVGYISKPVRIADAVYFMTAIGPQKWLRIPYDLAKAYFERGQVGGSGKEDYYRVLGIAKDADQDAIRAAYRSLARRYHRDVGTHPDKLVMQRVNEAYDVLSDEDGRAKYDRMIKSNSPSLVGWPGSGAGVLEVLGEDRGSLVCAVEILAFTRDQKFDRVTFFAGEHLEPDRPHAFVPTAHASIRFAWTYKGEIYSFELLNTFPDVRYAFSGTFDVEIEYRRRAHWNPDSRKSWHTWDVRDLRVLGYSAQ